MVDDDEDRRAAIAAGKAMDLVLPEETIAGVIANLALLERHRLAVAAVAGDAADGAPA